MQAKAIVLLVVVFSVLARPVLAQTELHFRQFTVAQGLNDGFINAISQDKYGFMWFASLGGLNRFNGSSMKFYHHIPGDQFSASGSLALCMASDSNGRFWIGFEDGLKEYDFGSGHFKAVQPLQGIAIRQILPFNAHKVFLVTSKGLAMFQPEKSRLSWIKNSLTGNSMWAVLSIEKWKDSLYMASTSGLFCVDASLSKLRLLPTGNIKDGVKDVCHDANGDIWLSALGETHLLRISAAGTVTNYTNWVSSSSAAVRNNINGIQPDRQGNAWIITNHDGVLRYTATNQQIQKFVFQQGMPGTLSENLVRSMFEDGSGTVWLGGSLGCNYTQPHKSLFSSIMPFPDSLDIRNRRIARGLAIDKTGIWWMTTGDGMVRHHPETRQYKVWNNKPGQPNQVYYNSIRGVACDDDNNVWIGTGAGVNCYRTATGTMEFITGDKLPIGFYFSVNKDRDGIIWFGCRDADGCYWYDPKSKSFHSIKEHAFAKHLAVGGVRYVMQDSRRRYWMGYNGAGVGMYDPAHKSVRFWNSNLSKDSGMVGSAVLDIKEDKKGIVWISTTNGITGIDTDHNHYFYFNKENGLLSNAASALAVDAYNRLWMATARGINMLDSSRKVLRAFTMADGLPTDQFPEHPGIVDENGNIIFPSFNGYVKFNPLAFKKDTALLPIYLANILVQNKPYAVPGEMGDQQQLNLGYEQNAFSFSFAVPNFENPDQTWYAYKLDGFDKDWTYTQKNEMSYTNVPGGSYTLHYKTTRNPDDWEVPAKQLGVYVATVFYKTLWFRLLVGLIMAAMLYYWYRSRLSQQREVLQLHNKAQLLEKEKVMVMYESLKQQLNPHFLFNSLTSLSSLIRLDQELAGNFLDRMSKIYRYILKSRDSETVSLREELEFTEHYIQLQKTRFEDGLLVKLSVADDDLDKKLAPVTIQNLVENAIKHNLISRSKPLIIEIFTEADYLVVRNRLQRKNFVETSNRQGLESMRSLYAFMHSLPMVIENGPEYFTVKIPLS